MQKFILLFFILILQSCGSKFIFDYTGFPHNFHTFYKRFNKDLFYVLILWIFWGKVVYVQKNKNLIINKQFKIIDEKFPNSFNKLNDFEYISYEKVNYLFYTHTYEIVIQLNHKQEVVHIEFEEDSF